MSEGQCGPGYYYDGLVEECKECFLRCSSPPSICTAYCTKSSESKGLEPFNIRLTLVLLFVFLSAFTTLLLLLLQMLRKKTCRLFPTSKVLRLQGTECPGTEALSNDIPEQTVVIMGQEDMVFLEATYNKTPDCNSSLPVPSTEEGTTILVTTKTVQIFNQTDENTEERIFVEV
ncbi:tumor necrosis factor receptor superfamily member 17 [Esox lucius]|uniref:BCMA TALL-1 binding domain-containing protein n=1 Tax=Esox lucius TaxID=8010 RepID=A0AAY5KVU1_ESOLU|nr:tumor necrosis factor receptor superfamily member 17 [Esox lucius]